ncbi:MULTISPECIES: SprT-like domain-containing protein [Chryseobacterium]|uniref:SprT protein n=1 Tax=Chryseobacterium camelliae TaxID=1265445 RepID=A0ABU0TM89_9FLAO|nr:MULTISPECIES: SprT-like domain-containing protein [Chryseobacterium]MDT3407981.1 SprT protein [Pseudacidovorax intermedius]MDQ1098162.1 SprT protein [Chryseobacterium camelliae]MDQ1102092.1 SprT protein [Chryseobacterium sp. SORGH_AS_1048]MDR6085530.1 SprT protein [Chryseobacterium sp. SORGH_AS_0909]MDR6129892.1 SprT protein [Chryseobacterium sp. SORGH_AS_1175]
MSIHNLEKYLPPNTLQYLKIWFSDYYIHIKITRDRHSKLGDYRKLPDRSHEITINSTLAPQLFFFVLTHELAHLIAFEKYGRRIYPHGPEWKDTFRKMLLESLEVYEQDLRPIITRFSKSPKANFMSSPELVRYFHIGREEDDLQFMEELKKGDSFMYRNEKYLLEGLIKKNYLCRNLVTGRQYSFKPLARVKKCS